MDFESGPPELAASPRHPVHLVAPLLALVGCATQTYEPEPLTAADFERVTREHFEGEPRLGRGVALTPELVASVFLDRNRELLVALEEYEEARAVAGIATPLPNPALSLGPQFVFGADPGVPDVVGVAGVQVAIPLSDRRGLADALNEERARAAGADAWATLRELESRLRGAYWAYGLELERERRQRELADATAARIDTVEQLVEAGTATAFDVSLFRLESSRTDARLLEAQIDRIHAAADLAALLAVGTNRLGDVPADLVPATGILPELPGLYDLVLERSPSLVRLRAAYAVAERELQLAIAEQVPDLVLGGNFGGNPGDATEVLGLTLGIELPIFDRNQREIANAHAHREHVRVHYESEVHRVWGEVERARLVLELALKRHGALRDDVLLAARTNAETARRAQRAGSADAVALLDAERSLMEVQIELLDAWLDELRAWTALERAVAAPLLVPASQPLVHPEIPEPSDEPMEPVR